jgi:hypothetical protein
VEAVFAAMKRAMGNGERIELRGFGVFHPVQAGQEPPQPEVTLPGFSYASASDRDPAAAVPLP